MPELENRIEYLYCPLQIGNGQAVMIISKHRPCTKMKETKEINNMKEIRAEQESSASGFSSLMIKEATVFD